MCHCLAVAQVLLIIPPPVVSKYGKCWYRQLTPPCGFHMKKKKKYTRHRGSTLVGTPKGTSHQWVYYCGVKFSRSLLCVVSTMISEWVNELSEWMSEWGSERVSKWVRETEFQVWIFLKLYIHLPESVLLSLMTSIISFRWFLSCKIWFFKAAFWVAGVNTALIST